MAKKKTAYVCTECGSDHSKWQGQCTDCGQWNTLQEFVVSSSKAPTRDARFEGYAGDTSSQGVQRLADINLNEVPRFTSGMAEFDRVLGGGLVPGSAILIGGHPGAGKSTLLLQTLCNLAAHMPVLYVTGEESLQQVAMRAQRLGLPLNDLQILSETNVERLTQLLQQHKPKIVVIDSIQVMHVEGIESAPGSVSQVRESAAYLTRFAKQTGTVLLLVGHVTKDGTLAGPKVLEHMIDCSIMLEGSGDSRYRVLRAIKNRFGAINELGVFAMLDTGLKEVKNPSSIFLSRSDEPAAGSVVMVIWEGTRPLLVEIQALVDDSHFGNPKRVAVGLDQNRLNLLLAVLHRHGGVHLGDQDVYINVVGGVKVSETGADLALLLAALSSFRNQPLEQGLIVFGEVGLSGEIRPVPSGQERIKEAAKHGFTRAIVPKANAPRAPIPGMEVIAVDKLQEAIERL
ncbi:MAG: DNA repair protein RadA [Thalassolituus sp.]|jgi:DNA repair protein RadA/Sms|uniref:DNA repair protein RadA n=2 Tax=root TaxID=1 RepID=M5E8D8_9GAMM|nr:DNA repair protein RadA [Thalassolituus oleivorans]PCI49529.1 MAG: DNA repair protein RadA [Oceanospirillales bacterium]PHQ88180.1 MAG: DNA repair protein RadA [Thalassobium sp.]AHK16788.1 DNA repair protein RadA [Thalassolituus oleivorans R6-15]APR68331.1 DNA repair protein RadA [Thalassolituus oleivorans]MBQ0726591.1 DNA repair protein RadA [Thalassolituus oleivorans]|tara:strand:+ start:5464 stop:6834 length:1371 start_codon:yes stop_codon:yes gene_type:complete